ncbi:retrovirus-related pol polyprotein from transposon TNT 1-94, partial [Tanacetum coccineum]
MDDPNMTMNEYIKLEEEKSHRRGRVFNWETATYGKIRVDDDLHDLRSVEAEFPAIVIDNAFAPQDTLPCKSQPRHNNESDLNNETSLSEYDEVEQNILYFNDLFPFNVIHPDDLKSDEDNDNNEIDIIQSSEDQYGVSTLNGYGSESNLVKGLLVVRSATARVLAFSLCEAALEVLPADMEAQTKDELNKKAHSVMILCLGNKVLREVTGETTAAGVWSKLEILYMTKSLANKLYLKKKLYTFYMAAGQKISEHIDEFNKIVLVLANIKVKFDDEDLALLLLTSLPASYENFMDTLLYGHEALTLEDVMATLNSKEIKERSKAKGDDDEGLYVREENLALLDWIMDSGCSYHMTPRECKIRGIGKVRIQLKDGSSFVLHNLRVVLSIIRRDIAYTLWMAMKWHAGLQVLEKQGLFGKKSLGKLDFYENYVLGKSYRVRGYEFIFSGSNMKHSGSSKEWKEANYLLRNLQVEVETAKLDNSFAFKKIRQIRKMAMMKMQGIKKLIRHQISQIIIDEEDTHEPLTYQETVACEDSSKWKVAMKEEMYSLRKNKTWELVDHPVGKNLVSCKWLFKIKEGIEGVQKPMYRQGWWLGFTPTRADYELEQLDVKTTFLHGNLEEVIYMKQPPRYEQGNKVCLLKKSLYGLKQSPRQWYRRFDEYMLSNGFKRSSYDSCVYYMSYAPRAQGSKEDSWYGYCQGSESQDFKGVTIWHVLIKPSIPLPRSLLQDSHVKIPSLHQAAPTHNLYM